MVLPINEPSDHSKIIKVFKGISLPDEATDNYKRKSFGKIFKWNETE